MAMESVMVPLGTPMPDVTLSDLAGNLVSLAEQAEGRPMLVAFLCNHCPYVRHLENRLGSLADELRDLGIGVVGVASNDVESYPDDGPDGMDDQIRRAGWAFPYLRDDSQDAARAFHAACTPDFFLYDADSGLAYRGAMDDSSPGNGRPVTGELLLDAATRVARGESVPEPHRPSMGCSLKWREG